MAALAGAIGLAIDLPLSVVDLLHGQQGLSGQGEIPFPIDGDRAALTRLLVELDVTRLALLGQRVGLCLQVLCLTLIDASLLEQEGGLFLEELRALWRTVRPWPPSSAPERWWSSSTWA